MIDKKPSDKKQRIVDAAIKLISKKGYHGATTALIAKEAGISQGIIFHYFKSKEGLFFSILKEKTNVFNQELEKSIADEKNALKKIEIAVSTYVKSIKKEEKFYEILIKQAKGSGLDFDRINKYSILETSRLIGNLIKEGVGQGVFRKVDIEVTATCLFGMVEFNALRWMVFGKKFSLENAAKNILDIFLRGITTHAIISRQ